MNIKEIFERERLYTASHIDNYEHNKSIDRVEAAVMAYNKRLEETVVTLHDHIQKRFMQNLIKKRGEA